MANRATVKGRMLLLAGAVAAVGAAAVLVRTDLLLHRGFGVALDVPRPGLSFEITSAPAQGAVAGDEGYWLTRADVESPALFAKPLAIGDRITIASRDGRERRLEVVDLKALGGSSAHAGRHGHARLLLVTCRVAGEAAERAEAHVRFIIEAESAELAPPAPAKAL
jgi:hypothetical protein